MRTFSQWHRDHPDVGLQRLPDNRLQVFSRDPGLWDLVNRVVTGAYSGPSVILEPKPCGWYACRVHNERWCVCQDFTARYLNSKGEWDSPMYAEMFNSQVEADTFGLDRIGYAPVTAP